MDLPLEDGTTWTVTPQFQQELCAVYEKINVAQELSKAKGWLLCNPARRKTRRGIKRFIATWLNHAVDAMPKTHNHISKPCIPSCCDCTAPSVGKFGAASYCDSHLRLHQDLGR